MLRWLLAAAHLLALGIGLGAVWARARALRDVARGGEPGALNRALAADAWWGVAAILWIGTGLWRLLAGTEKTSEYYFANHVFWLKMTLFGVVFALELAPMISLVRWRMALGRGETPDVSRAGRWMQISYLQAVLLVFILLTATAMARGISG